MYIVRDCCEDEQMESALPSGDYERLLMIGDRMIRPSRDNELFFQSPHNADDLYGDIIMVNGVPWPVMRVQPRTYRFRVLNIGITRTYTLSLSDRNIPLYLVGTDGGLLQKAIRIQEWIHEVGARYEVVIDFSNLPPGREIILRNSPLPDFNQDTFCWTHVIMKFIVDSAVSGLRNTPVFDGLVLRTNNELPLAKVVPKSVIDNAVLRAKRSEYDKYFRFDRSGGQWTINGRTWDAAQGRIEHTVKGNGIEVWAIENGESEENRTCI